MSKKYLDNLIGKKVKEEMYGKTFDFTITRVEEEIVKDEDWLDGSFTKEELMEIIDELEDDKKQYKVYGKIKDIKLANELQKLSEESYYQMIRGCTGLPFMKNDYKNEILLKIYKDGELPY